MSLNYRENSDQSTENPSVINPMLISTGKSEEREDELASVNLETQSVSEGSVGGGNVSTCRLSTVKLTPRKKADITQEEFLRDSLDFQMAVRNAREVFHFLPVYGLNDMVHGSWWFVWGSVLSLLIAIIPLIDIYDKFFTTPEATQLKAFDEASTWIFIIISSFFFTLGSYAFVLAFEDRPKKLLFKIPLVENNEQLGAWLTLYAMIPYIPYSIVYIQYNPSRLAYWGTFFASIFFTIAAVFFVYTSYPHDSFLNKENIKPKTLQVIIFLFGENSFLCKHCQNDWLVGCWMTFYACLFAALGCYLLLLMAENDRQIFIYLTGFCDCGIFLLGSMYYVAGSYPSDSAYSKCHVELETVNVIHEKVKQ